MQSLPFKSPVRSIASCGNKFVITTNDGEIFIADSNKCIVESQLSFPSSVSNEITAIFSRDGDFVWALANGKVYYSPPVDGSQFTLINLDTPISKIYPHNDGISIIALPSIPFDPNDNNQANKKNSEIIFLKPSESGSPIHFEIPSPDPIVGIVFYEKKLTIITSAPNSSPIAFILSGGPLQITKKIPIADVKARAASLSFTASCGSGFLVFWSDGFWKLFTPSSPIITGNAISSESIDVCGNRILCVNPTKLKIFDLKFDAQLEKFKIEADHALLFPDRIAVVSGALIRFLSWRGEKTTTRSLLGSLCKRNSNLSNSTLPESQQSEQFNGESSDESNDELNDESNELTEKFNGESIEKLKEGSIEKLKEGSVNKEKEFWIDISYDPEQNNPLAQDVKKRTAHFRVKNVRQVVEAVMENRGVPERSKQKVLEIVENDPQYEEIRDLVRFQLSSSISLQTVLDAIEAGKRETVLLLLKKLKPLTGEELSILLKLLLNLLNDPNESKQIEVIFAHVITQPHETNSIEKAIEDLSTNEADLLLSFLTLLLKSRRKWRELEASLSTEDAILFWGSIIIKKHMTDFALKNVLSGMKELKDQLEEENQCIEAAGKCWSILSNVGKKQNLPPCFMYLVDHYKVENYDS